MFTGALKLLYTTLFLLLLGGVTHISAQIKVTGTVSDDIGEPLVGVVVLNNSNQSINAVTDLDGKYEISVEENAVLRFSILGFETHLEDVKGRNHINVSMIPSNQMLDDVVVIGYGSVKKKDLTGAVSVIKTEAIRDRASSDIAGALKGLASGVKVTSGGLAGSSATITIRGLGNLTNNEPLYIIDGFPSSGGLHLNMQDIESIQVLKDASSAAIYGSRAANGVIIITTKQGKEGPLKVEFNAQLTSNWLPRYDLMGAEEYKRMNDMAYDEAIRQGIDGVTSRQNHFEGDTDWQDEMLKNGLIQNYNISLAGGQKTGRFYASLNRMSDSGTVMGTGYEKYGFRVNTSGEKGIFSYGENLFYTTSKRKGLNGNPFANFIAMSPTIPVYDENNPGGFGYGNPDRANTYGLNPIAMQNLHTQMNRESSLKGNIYAQINLFKMFSAKLNIGYTEYDGTTNSLRKVGNWTMGQGTDKSYITKDNYKSRTFLIEHTYNFKHKFGDHDVDALFGVSNQSDRGEQHYTTRLDVLTNNGEYIPTIDAATGTTTGGSHVDRAALISYLGRINYSYADKYLFSATMRRDGTSRLPKVNRWETYPSFSLGWRISEERFFNVPFIDALKIRGNYGILGGSNIGYWDYQAIINTAPRAILGSPEQIAIGMTQSKIVNSDLRWEKTKQYNIGFDATMLDSKLTVSAEYFSSKSEDVLVYLPILLTTGNAGGNPAVNAASLRNSGVEIDLGWRDNIGKDFSYGASLNISRIRNKLLKLGYGQTEYYEYLSKAEIGQPLGSFYLFKTLGIFQNEEQIQNYKNSEGKVIQPNAEPGDVIYADTNDDGIINTNDRQIVGSPWPKLEMGLSLTAAYKGFDLLVSGYGRFGHDVWNGSAAAAADMANNQNNFKGYNPWTQSNPSMTVPRAVFGDSRNSRGDQDRWIESGSFFRIGEISLGYNLPKTVCSKIYMDNVRAGVTLQNLVTFTSYSGLDPDFNDGGIFTLSADNCSYPNYRAVLFSLSLGF
ncbi:TonB-dependent receptor [Dysgonomonas sp. Marseille-P4677]|nr:TonB-dependent receptor [Dysgonomonas sp. Marseille-P4677]